MALLVAASSALWEATTFGPGPPEVALVAVRVIETLAALAIAYVSEPTRSVRELQLLCYLLALDVAGANLVVMILQPTTVWEVTAIVSAVMLGAALFAPWPWPWQASLAAVITALTLTALIVAVPRDVVPAAMIPRLGIILLTIAAASVLGARLQEKERRRVAASEERYRSLFEGAGDAIAVLDPEGHVLEANPRCLELLGRPATAVLGRRLWEFQLPEAPGAMRPADATQECAAALRGEVRHSAYLLARPDGQPLEVELTLARVEGPDGPVLQATLRDLTERRAAERRREREQRLESLTRLAGGFAHQFNNLLGGILTHASALRDDPALARAQAELEQIVQAARRGAELTKELLRFSRHAPLAVRPVPPADVLQSVAELARTTLPDSVAVELQAAPDLPAIAADPDHLVHACLELVLNARDAMSRQRAGRLTLSAGVETVGAGDRRWPDAAPGRYVRFSITDTGVGMDAATLERVFEPFFTTRPMHQAPGLGLAQVYRVVKDHHGAVRIDSAPRRGTTVHLLIPIAVEQPQPAPVTAAESAAAAEPAAGTAGTVLVVDDEEIVRSSLRRALTRFGYRVLEAWDGGTALAALQGADPPVDLVILDLVLPGGGAGIFEVLKAIRPDVKVLVSSGYSPDEESARALAARADGFLPKPYEMAELKRAVARALGRAAA
ncbi:MAG TPA: ATP-binding protein [Gemmatimonadales bacterium]|nr:ATP-binding protein [Gemmatimonadales bacterium]